MISSAASDERAAFHVTQRALAAHADTRDGERRETFDEQQPREDVNREIQDAVEGIDKHRHPDHQPDAADHRQRDPTAAQIVHAQQKQHELDHDVTCENATSP